jgi:FixJ family two-component response regulator
MENNKTVFDVAEEAGARAAVAAWVRLKGLRAETAARLATLTENERDVFRRLLAGHANKRIATDLELGLRTVELRRANIMKKMQATSLPDLVRMAILIDLMKLDGSSQATS